MMDDKKGPGVTTESRFRMLSLFRCHPRVGGDPRSVRNSMNDREGGVLIGVTREILPSWVMLFD